MAFLGYSDDFELDDDGILRDSADSCGILIDDDGIVRDDFDLLSKHGSSTHWTDSGLGGDKQSSTPSTLRQLDLQSYPSFEDVSRNFDESNVNISDLEASKDDLSFDEDFDDRDKSKNYYGQDLSHSRGNRSGLSSRSSFDHSLNYDDEIFDDKKISGERQDLFGEEYYKQLQELGVLVDENDFPNPRDSLQEFENIETDYSRDGDDHKAADDDDEGVGEAIEDFLQRNAYPNTSHRNGANVSTNVDDSMDIETPHDNDISHGGFQSYDHQGYSVNEGGKRTRPNTASSTRTISSRSFPEISPEEALELYTERVHDIDNDDSSIHFDNTQSQQSQQSLRSELIENDNDDEIFFIPSQENDGESPKPAKMPAYDNENVPSVTLNESKSRSRSGDDTRSRSITPQYQEEGYSDRSRSATPHGHRMEGDGYHSNEERNDSLTQVTRLDSRNKTRSDSDSFRPDSALSEMSSAASESRSARPKSKKPPSNSQNHKAKGNLSHAISQESFFDTGEGVPSKKSEKGPKRLLPKPSSGEMSQSFKVKSKSTTNISLGPLKPTHMSLSEIRSIHSSAPDFEMFEHSEPKSNTSDVPKGELTKKLKQESTKRQHATQLVQQLQGDYDKLLSKYALAELTIDQMRLGTKISIHANSPTPSQATSGSITSAQHMQMLQLTGAQRGIASASPQIATSNVFNFPPETVGADGSSVDGRQSLLHRGTSPALPARPDSVNSMDSTSTPRGDVEEPGGIANDAEKVKLGLLFQSRNLDERMQSFQSLLGDDQLNLEEQEGVFEKIRGDHEKLRRVYLQSKEDYNVVKRSSSVGADVNFDQEKELEGELFRLGMKFDEIHEKVEENLKEKSAKRQPFQKHKRRESADSGEGSVEPDPSTENMKRKMFGSMAGDDLVQPKPNKEFDKKVKHLHEEYNALMDRYRRLKQMGRSPEGEKEIDNLVRKLHMICNEEPDIFKLPPDLQDRADRMAANKIAKTQKHPPTKQSSKSPTKPTSPEKRRLPDPLKNASKGPAKSYEILTASETWSLAESMDRWERSKMVDDDLQQMSRSRENLSRSRENLSRSRDNLNTSAMSSRSSRYDEGTGSGGRDNDETDSKLRAKDRAGSYNSLSSRGRQTPDNRGRYSPDNRGRYSPDSRGRYTPDSRGRDSPDSMYNDRGSPIPNLPRPRRHDHPDRERRDRRELKKSPDPLLESVNSLTTDSGVGSLYSRHKKSMGGSTTSLQDSGISEHEGGATGTSGPNSPLSKLPGPGKFKQMTGRREHDTDSGFIGSMVGSEVSAGNLSSRRQPPQSPVRLHHPGDQHGNQRPSSRQSSRSDDSARGTTPRSGRSVASSKSSRRTPTKAFPLPTTSQSEGTATEAHARTPTEARAKTPTRNDSRNRSRDQVTQHSRDYTDDSYTTVTESEMSFDSDMRPRRSKGAPSRNTSLRNIDKIVEDSEEERPSTIQSKKEQTRTSNKSSSKQAATPSRSKVTEKQPVKGQTSKQPSKNQSQGQSQGQTKGQPKVQQGRRRSEVTDDDMTSTMSLTNDSIRDNTQDTTADSYTTDEETPRSVIERERKSTKHKTSSSAPRESRANESRPAEVAPPRNVTPVKVSRSEIHPKKFYNTQERGPEVKAPEQHRLGQQIYVDKGIGSGSDESILASDAGTAMTRGSVNSQRLKLLTDELGKLREEFKRSNQERHHPVAPPQLTVAPPQDPQQGYYDQYFDPTEDPLAFMRGPRRRANSFTGHGVRDYDYDWTLRNPHGDGDIPLGYAAADSYSTHRVRKPQNADEVVDEAATRSRGRRRLKKRIDQRTEQNGYESDQSPTRMADEVHAAPTSARVQGHFGYHSPHSAVHPSQQPTASTQQTTGPQGTMEPGRRVFGSQPNLAYSGYQPPPQPTSVSGSTKSSTNTSSRPLRQTLYSYAANPNQNRPPPPTYHDHNQNQPIQRQYASDDIYINDGQTRFIPHGAMEGRSVWGGTAEGIYTSSCPLCGASSYHTHGEYVFPPPDSRTPVGYIVQNGREIIQSVTVPVFSLPLDVPIPPAPKPSLSRKPLRTTQSFRLYKRPPPIKQNLFPINTPINLQAPPNANHSAPPTKPQPMAANHDVGQQPIIIQLKSHDDDLECEPRQRARSKSGGRMGRIRHYSPDGRTRSRYFVREFGESDSAGSDVEELPRGRSRSVGRRRHGKHGRKYKRVRGEDAYESDRLIMTESTPNIMQNNQQEMGDNSCVVAKGDNLLMENNPVIAGNIPIMGGNIPVIEGDYPGQVNSAAAEDDLNRSLRLVGEIDDLTHKMMNTVGGELSKSKRMKEFGSSMW